MRITRLLLISSLATLASCSENSGDATVAELKAAREAGRKQAQIVVNLPENSMEREKAIFQIRARETRLRDAGFESCADAYIEAAAEVLGYDK